MERKMNEETGILCLKNAPKADLKFENLQYKTSKWHIKGFRIFRGNHQ